MPEQKTIDRLKELIVEALCLEGTVPSEIGDEDQLFGGELGLDSVDALELVAAIEKTWKVRIESQDIAKEAFSSVLAIAGYVEELIAAQHGS